MPGMFSTWYNNQYASWNRTRSLQAAPFVARVDSQASRNATTMHNGTDVNPGGARDVVINMGELGASPNAVVNISNKDNKDTLFGPSIGVVGNAPEWCTADAELDEKIFKSEKELNEKDDGDDGDIDELTPEIVKEWVCRSKEPAVPTTTLQALVNLKRPSIRLSPLAASSSDFSSSDVDQSSDAQTKHHQQHGLEFEFDCDAPSCAITLHVVGVPSHLSESEELQQRNKSTADIHTSTDGKESERLLLFETTLPGGFGRKLTLAEGAILELARLEAAAHAHRAQLAAATVSADGSKDNKESSITDGPAAAGSIQVSEHHKKRFHFFRKRGNAISGSSANPSSSLAPVPALPAGPALAVVDAEASPHSQIPASGLSVQSQNTLSTFFAGGEVERARRKKVAEEEGVRVAIRLVAQDAEGKSMKVRNEQVTYLHIVRQGPHHSTAVTTGGDTSASGAENTADTEQEAKEAEEKEKDDTRPWVVKVVKREARIGAHAFQLHEIYGLTAHASASDGAAHSVTPSAPAESHTYPPQPGQPELPLLNGSGAAAEDDSAAECLLCLSAPREVVLLPCRHLVACRDCAVNMVEFGAGGTVAQPEADAPAANGTGGETIGDGTAGAGTQGDPAVPVSPTPTPAPAATTRRKRKAKGWFCPVCRQPYTSLLRITTAPPPSKGVGLGHTGGGNGAGDAKRVSLASSVDADSASSSASSPVQQAPIHPLAPTPELATSDGNEGSATVATTDGQTQISTPMRGAFASIARPGFLRGLSGRAVSERDLERGA